MANQTERKTAVKETGSENAMRWAIMLSVLSAAMTAIVLVVARQLGWW